MELEAVELVMLALEVEVYSFEGYIYRAKGNLFCEEKDGLQLLEGLFSNVSGHENICCLLLCKSLESLYQ